MAETFDYLLDVNPKKLAWNFNVYVVRISEVPNKYNEKEIGSIEMILQDSKGDRIHASIPKSVVARWKGNIFEFQMYVMSNFIVVGNKTKPKTTNSNWILMFSQRTTVTHINNPSYPLEAFHFRSISDLLNAERLDDTYLFGDYYLHYLKNCCVNFVQNLFFKIDSSCSLDVIAEVVRKEDPRDLATSTGKETKRMVVVLEDLENNRIECTLFGEMVDQIRPHFEEGSVEPLIVVLQYFKTSRWNGKTTVQNHFYISKIHIERDLKEGAWSAADELKHGSVGVKTIEESLNVAKKVPKKVETSTIERYEYKGCGHTAGTASIRYKVKVIVYDGTGSMTLLLWDRKAIQLCEKRADQIKEEEDVVEEVVSSLKYKTPAKRALNGVKSSTTTINENDEE
ncbi:replication protein A 70 kDa DNA-binding subunit A-like isoform [Arachis hypogaea]|nr:replication protein A 70 kDa DNA-binding subunit A-like isoform [Arachis hypogaea]